MKTLEECRRCPRTHCLPSECPQDEARKTQGSSAQRYEWLKKLATPAQRLEILQTPWTHWDATIDRLRAVPPVSDVIGHTSPDNPLSADEVRVSLVEIPDGSQQYFLDSAGSQLPTGWKRIAPPLAERLASPTDKVVLVRWLETQAHFASHNDPYKAKRLRQAAQAIAAQAAPNLEQAVLDERERCARICDEQKAGLHVARENSGGGVSEALFAAMAVSAFHCADAIRGTPAVAQTIEELGRSIDGKIAGYDQDQEFSPDLVAAADAAIDRLGDAAPRKRIAPTAQRIYLVATGQASEGGAELYERHENHPPPMCDAELLWSSPPSPEMIREFLRTLAPQPADKPIAAQP